MIINSVGKSIVGSMNHPAMTPASLQEIVDGSKIRREQGITGSSLVLYDNKTANELDAIIAIDPSRKKWIYDKHGNLKIYISTEKRHGGSGSDDLVGKGVAHMRITTLKKHLNKTKIKPRIVK